MNNKQDDLNTGTFEEMFSHVSFTPYNEEGKYCSPRVLQGITLSMRQSGFEVRVGKPPLFEYSEELKQTGDFSAEEIKSKLTSKSNELPGKGRFGIVRCYNDGIDLERGYLYRYLNVHIPKLIAIQYTSEQEINAYAVGVSGSKEYKLYGYLNTKCNSESDYEKFCELVLGRGFGESLDILLEIRKMESPGTVRDESKDEIILE